MMDIDDLRAYASGLDAELRSAAATHDLDEPFIGAVTLRTAASSNEYRVGERRVPGSKIVDWRHPLAGAYFTDPGERFSLVAPGYALVEGRVDRRAALTVAGRAVRAVRVQTPSQTVRLVAGPEGFDAPEARDAKASGLHLGDLRSLLTPAQYRLISSSRGQALIVRGRAGSGKTSVALHRVAWLAYPGEAGEREAVDPSRVLIVMYNRALADYVRGLLVPLGLTAARLDTFHAWALGAVSRGYRGKIKIDQASRPGAEAAAAVKKHVGILAAVDAFVARQVAAADDYLAEKLAPYGDTGATWVRRWRATAGPVVRRLVGLRRAALNARDAARGLEAQRLVEIHKVFVAAVTRVTLYKEELVRLLTDSTLLAAHLPGVSAAVLAEAAAFQRALATVDGSERHPGPGVRFDDLAILIRLMQVKNGGLPDSSDDEKVHTFDHLVVDEAQDFGAVELAVLFGAVRARTGVTIVGDLNQKIVPDADFLGWDGIARALGLTGAQVCALEVGHRSTGPIVALADALVGEAPSEGRPGALPRYVAVAPERVAEAVADEVLATLADDPAAHVAVVLPRREEVGPLMAALSGLLGGLCAVREGYNKEFVFAPGVTVTNRRQVKGLEFDSIVLVEPSASHYPDTLEGRRNLYTTVTRARDRLAFVGSQPLSPLLAPLLAAGLIEAVGVDLVPPAEIDALDEPL